MVAATVFLGLLLCCPFHSWERYSCYLHFRAASPLKFLSSFFGYLRCSALCWSPHHCSDSHCYGGYHWWDLLSAGASTSTAWLVSGDPFQSVGCLDGSVSMAVSLGKLPPHILIPRRYRSLKLPDLQTDLQSARPASSRYCFLAHSCWCELCIGRCLDVH